MMFVFSDDASDGDVEPCDTKIDTTAFTGRHYGQLSFKAGSFFLVIARCLRFLID